LGGFGNLPNAGTDNFCIYVKINNNGASAPF